MSTAYARAAAGEPTRLALCGAPVRNRAVMLLVSHEGELIFEPIPGEDGLAPDELHAVDWLLEGMLRLRRGGDDEFPEIDEDRDFVACVGHAPVQHLALVMAGCHDGSLWAARIPDADGHTLSQMLLEQILRDLIATLMHDLADDAHRPAPKPGRGGDLS